MDEETDHSINHQDYNNNHQKHYHHNYHHHHNPPTTNDHHTSPAVAQKVGTQGLEQEQVGLPSAALEEEECLSQQAQETYQQEETSHEEVRPSQQLEAKEAPKDPKELEAKELQADYPAPGPEEIHHSSTSTSEDRSQTPFLIRPALEA